eukprot:jgi/Botrbrau1/5278/Bobra.0172s0133.1
MWRSHVYWTTCGGDGAGSPVGRPLLERAERRIDALEAASGTLPEAASAAQGVALLAHMTEFFRASRVVDFRPLFQLARRLSERHVALPNQDVELGAAAPEVLPDQDQARAMPLQPEGDEDQPVGRVRRMGARVARSGNAAVPGDVHAHGKAVGASGGAAALAAGCGAWAPALTKGDINLMPAVRRRSGRRACRRACSGNGPPAACRACAAPCGRERL